MIYWFICPFIFFCTDGTASILIVTADEVGDGGAMGDSAVAVAELPVVKAFKAGVGVVV